MKEKKRVYFIRHGQSMGNVNKVFQNTNDPLTELGKIQAVSVAKKTALFKADVVLTSPLTRAYETAEAIVKETGLPLETNELLREYLSPTKLWNLPLNSPESKDFYNQMLEHLDDPTWHYEDEDNYHDLYNRASTLLEHLVKREEKTIIAVTHGAFMRILLATMMTEGKPDAITAVRLVRFLSQKNTGITSCEYNLDTVNGNSWRLVAWNDYAHLSNGGLDNSVSS
jgi:broad specificity phosphatase PhoE